MIIKQSNIKNLKNIKEIIKSSLFEFFEYFYNNYYKEIDDYAIIKMDDNAFISEAIGYGMLIFLYFSKYDLKYIENFNKLFNTYKKCLNQHGLMQWKFENFYNIDVLNNKFYGSATDADLDVAYSLILASEMYNNDYYLNEAKNIINNIKKYEIKNNILLPGDYWKDEVLNLSYYDLTYFKKFSTIDDKEYWNKVIENTYLLFNNNIEKNENGIFSDWSNINGYPINEFWNNKNEIVYGYEAVRIPYRLLKNINNKEYLQKLFYKFYNFLLHQNINNLTSPLDIFNRNKSHYYKEIYTLSFILIFYLFDDHNKINEYFEHFLKYKYNEIYYYESALTCLYLIEIFELLNKA